MDNLDVPFKTTVLGVEVTVESVDLTVDGCIVAICARGAVRQVIRLLDLPLPTPLPAGAEWIYAYRNWLSLRRRALSPHELSDLADNLRTITAALVPLVDEQFHKNRGPMISGGCGSTLQLTITNPIGSTPA
jgi:hypothetical protein